MCVIVPGYNNNALFRIEQSLNSLFRQNYTNYYAVIIDDGSTDGSDALYRKYLEFYGIDPANYVYYHNQQNKGSLENVYDAIHNHCAPDSIAMVLDGDDEFADRNVLKALNAGYQSKHAGVIYSNFFWFNQKEKLISLGETREYDDEEKKLNRYRKLIQKFSQLRTFRS